MRKNKIKAILDDRINDTIRTVKSRVSNKNQNFKDIIVEEPTNSGAAGRGSAVNNGSVEKNDRKLRRIDSMGSAVERRSTSKGR